MRKIESQVSCTQNCSSCVHFDYCLINWGTECKRQGGNKIPRMKSKAVNAKSKVNPKKSNKSGRSEKSMNNNPRNKIFKMVEPIRTKVANW